MTINSPILSHITRNYKSYFPLTSINDIVILFNDILQPNFLVKEREPKDIFDIVNNYLLEILRKEENNVPLINNCSKDSINIGFLSLLLGYVEFKLTCSSFKNSNSSMNKHRHQEVLSQSLSVDVSDFNSAHSNASSPNLVPNQTPESSFSGSTVSSPVIRKIKRPRRSSSSSYSRPRKRNISGISAPEKIMESMNHEKKIFVNTADSGVNSDHSSPSINFLHVNFDDIFSNYQKIHQKFASHPKLLQYFEANRRNKKTELFATKELIKIICDIISSSIIYHKGSDKWNHSQTLFSFINSNTLDGFGLAITVYSVCELFQIRNVWLSLSEEYAWIDIPLSYEDNKIISLDVSRYIYEKSEDICVTEKNIRENWMYLKGISVSSRVQPFLSLAAIITSIQPTKDPSLVNDEIAFNRNTTTIPEESNSSASPCNFHDWIDKSPNKKSQNAPVNQMISSKMVDLKHRLLWLLESKHLLDQYPVGLSNLADLEENFPTPINLEGINKCLNIKHEKGSSDEDELRRKLILHLYKLAVDANLNVYHNKQVYPYLNYANCCLRSNKAKEAFRYWSVAATVVSQYNHGNEDTEVYKELLEIATNLLPSVSRVAFETLKFGPTSNEQMTAYLNTVNILDDPECFAFIITFIDGLCVWEQDSDVPVLHIGWVDNLMKTLLRFSPKAASVISIKLDPNSIKKYELTPVDRSIKTFEDTLIPNSKSKSPNMNSTGTEPMVHYESDLCTILNDLDIPLNFVVEDFNQEKFLQSSKFNDQESYLDYLVMNCQTKLLNLNHLLSFDPDQPFLTKSMIKENVVPTREIQIKQDPPENETPKEPIKSEVKIKVEETEQVSEELASDEPQNIEIIIHSEKVKSIASLMKNLSSKQNVSAIKLALTAQMNKSGQNSDTSTSTSRSTRRSSALNSSLHQNR